MGYGYGMQIPAHRVGGPKNIWDFKVYGLSKSWVMRGSTVTCSPPLYVTFTTIIQFMVDSGYPLHEQSVGSSTVTFLFLRSERSSSVIYFNPYRTFRVSEISATICIFQMLRV
jgi:hypothetical protein